MSKIITIVIMGFAFLVALICILFKIKLNGSSRYTKSMRGRFLFTVSLIMAFLTGCNEKQGTPEYQITPGSGVTQNIRTEAPTCYKVMVPTFTPGGTPSSTEIPLCYLVPGDIPTPAASPKATQNPIIMPKCYEAMAPTFTPITKQASPTYNNEIPTCYTPSVPVTPKATPLVTPSPNGSVKCYLIMTKPAPTQAIYNSDEEIRQKKLALIEEIREKGTVKEELIIKLKDNLFNKG